ncbi:hypothetical protein [Chryseobacterium sp. KLBC 52]|uniref:hypothetical protein n=1 Tax=Chryseobacterium sp. KLBC 52 TaxID=1862702 RepID=UPI000E0C6698|nr:hypothetical protein [Chryseobacterium sp. KLBC 52]
MLTIDLSYASPYIKAELASLGPWGKGAHTENETLEIEALTIATQRTALFILKYVNCRKKERKKERKKDNK